MKKLTTIELLFLAVLISGCTLTIGTSYPGHKSRTAQNERGKVVATRYAGHGTAYHTVRKGENLYRISLYYGVSVDDIKKANHLSSSDISTGQRLLVPGTEKKQPFFALTPDTTKELLACPAPQQDNSSAAPPVTPTPILKDSRFDWPVNGKVICNYGELGNKGLDILVDPGTTVYAAADGTVAYTGTTAKYGETIILKHESDFYTVYGHDIKAMVKKGQKIRKGDAIAQIKGGSQARRYLHFEIRSGDTPVNPWDYIQQKAGSE